MSAVVVRPAPAAAVAGVHGAAGRTWPAALPGLRALVDRRVALPAAALGVPPARARAWGPVSAAVGSVWTAQDSGRVDPDVLARADASR
jgi:streptomycin 6-kinase